MTRNRMLNVIEERNIYNKKIIYTIVSVIFGLFILMLLAYVYNNKNYNSKKVTSSNSSISNSNS